MPGRDPPPTPDPIPPAPVNRLLLRRAHVDSFSDEDIQHRPVSPDSVKEQLPMVVAGTRRGWWLCIACFRELLTVWMRVDDSNSSLDLVEINI